LESKIIEGQKTDNGIFHIKEKIKEKPSQHFKVDEQGVLWFDDRPRIESLGINSWMKLTFLSYLSILEVVRCIKN
jgi:hypothetical protein